VVAVALVESAPPADACSVVQIEDQQLDPAYSTDTVAPSAVMASPIVQRQTPNTGCGGVATKCGSDAWIAIASASQPHRTIAVEDSRGWRGT
jgi:hypothetical protein